MRPPPLVEKLLHPTRGVLRGLFGDETPAGKGGPDKDAKLIKITVGELREIDSALRQLNAECERAWKAYQIVHEQAMANGSELHALRQPPAGQSSLNREGGNG